jgi:uncharacterized RDD family membrane protein YckC
VFCSNCGSSISESSTFCINCGSKVSPPAGTSAPPHAVPPVPVIIVPAMDYASWGNRAVGYIIDSLFVGAVMLALYVVLGGFLTAIAGLGGRDAMGGMCCLILLLFPLATLLVGLYNRVYLVSKRGYSIGQGVVKVKVVDANGALLPQGTALVRLLVQAAMGLVPVLPLLDLLWPLWDDRRQTLHDKAANCYVINNPQRG